MMRDSYDRLVTVRAPGDRKLDVLVSGPGSGLPLVFHHGTPGGLVGYGPMVEAASVRGLRTVLYARPGYGGSTPMPDRLVADAAADVAAILDQIGADQFITAGWSGGGPHALACAARMPGRCLAAASIAGPAPHDTKALDWLDGMADENVAEFNAAAAGEAELTKFLEKEAGPLREVVGADVAKSLGGLVSGADKAALTSDFAEYLAALMRAGVSLGIDGWRDDDLAFTRGWGFGVAALGGAAVAIWQGDEDRMVPRAHGDWLAANISMARARLLPGDGHLTLIVDRFAEILDDLLDMAGLTRPPGR
jgi:pimeloyl-ACP methyl ester carboxylesterase